VNIERGIKRLLVIASVLALPASLIVGMDYPENILSGLSAMYADCSFAGTATAEMACWHARRHHEFIATLTILMGVMVWPAFYVARWVVRGFSAR